MEVGLVVDLAHDGGGRARRRRGGERLGRRARSSLLYTRSYTYTVAQIGLLEPPGFQFGFPGGPLSPRFSLGSIVIYGLSTNLYGGSGFLQKTSEYWFLTLASDIICCGDLFISIIRRSYLSR